jgi:hypothetical protein
MRTILKAIVGIQELLPYKDWRALGSVISLLFHIIIV